MRRRGHPPRGNDQREVETSNTGHPTLSPSPSNNPPTPAKHLARLYSEFQHNTSSPVCSKNQLLFLPARSSSRAAAPKGPVGRLVCPARAERGVGGDAGSRPRRVKKSRVG